MGGVGRPAVAVWFVAALSLAAWAADAQGIELAEEGGFREWYDERAARVRGDIVMGVMLVEDGAPRPSHDVAVPLMPGPAGETREVCVRITSKDGRFEAENTYRVDGAYPEPGGAFPYRGEYAALVADARAVALVREGSCVEGSEVAAPSLWGGRPAPAPGGEATLYVYVNSAGNPTDVAVGDEYFACADGTDPDALKYTAACAIPLPALARAARDGAARLTVFVTRSLGEEEFDLTVLVPHDGG
jgi:hypothetical protein